MGGKHGGVTDNTGAVVIPAPRVLYIENKCGGTVPFTLGNNSVHRCGLIGNNNLADGKVLGFRDILQLIRICDELNFGKLQTLSVRDPCHFKPEVTVFRRLLLQLITERGEVYISHFVVVLHLIDDLPAFEVIGAVQRPVLGIAPGGGIIVIGGNKLIARNSHGGDRFKGNK